MHRLTILATLLIGSLSLTAADYDLVILNGRVIDPESGHDAMAHVGITDGTIQAITSESITGKTTIDATNHVVSPGFIDLHAHGMHLGDMRMQAMQGVTTVLELESGLLPIADWYANMAAQQTPIHYGAAAGWTYGRIAAFANESPEATIDYFLGAQGENAWKADIADPLQLAEILHLVEQGLKEGGLGIGINAGYAPGYGQKEYYALAKLAAEYGVATYTHVRYASNTEPEASFEAIKELIANSALTGAHMHICHLNSSSLADIESTLELVEAAKAKGINITVEAYPYGAANTVVGAAMFTGDGWRERMRSTSQNFQLGADRMSEDELADYQDNRPGTMITWHFLDEEDPEDLAILDASVTHPDILISSDAVLWSYFDENGVPVTYTGDAWPLPEKVFSHPRSSGAFAKILRSYVRERGLMTLNEAIRKMSLMPAQTLEGFVPQMKQKGRLQVGMDADIAIFDPTTVADRATFENANQPAVGVQTVLVNGSFVVRDGELVIEANAGQPIRR